MSFKKFNQYLLERYPTVWNTKILTVLGMSILAHLLFFVLGFGSYNPEDYRSTEFEGGLTFFHVIISILILLYWVVSMSKNNAFEDYYPTSALQLFTQFLHFFVIVFSVTTFYFSYKLGVVAYAKNNLFETELKQDIDKVNKGAIFLSNKHNSYAYNLFHQTAYSSYYNYGKFFISTDGEREEFNKYVCSVLDSPNHRQKITKILQDFLEVADKYNIRHNLTVESWLDVVYSDKQNHFGVYETIGTSQYDKGLYIESYELQYELQRKRNLFSPKFEEKVHFFLWFSLAISLALFMVRTTGLRLFLFTIVYSSLISIFVGLLILMSGLPDKSIAMIPLFVCLIIIVLPYATIIKNSDRLSGILLNMSLPAFPLALLFLLILNDDSDFSPEKVSFFFFVLTIQFVFTRTFLIKKWKGLPEA